MRAQCVERAPDAVASQACLAVLEWLLPLTESAYFPATGSPAGTGGQMADDLAAALPRSVTYVDPEEGLVTVELELVSGIDPSALAEEDIGPYVAEIAIARGMEGDGNVSVWAIKVEGIAPALVADWMYDTINQWVANAAAALNPSSEASTPRPRLTRVVADQMVDTWTTLLDTEAAIRLMEDGIYLFAADDEGGLEALIAATPG